MKAKFHLSHSPHRWIVGAGMALMVVVMTIAALQIWQRRTATIADSMGDAEHYVAIMAEHTSQTLKSAELVLESITIAAQESGINSTQELRDLLGTKPMHDILRERASGASQVDVASIVDANGDMVNFTRNYPPRSTTGSTINIADRDYFKAHLADPSLDIYLSAPVKNRGNDKWTFYLAKKIRGKSGQMLGLALTGIESRYFERFYQRTRLSEKNAVAMFRRDGILLSRFPFTEELIGKSFREGPAFRALEKRTSATFLTNFTVAQTSDNSTRIVAARVVGDYPIYHAVVIDEDTIFTDWRQDAVFIASISVVLCAIVLLLVMWLRSVLLRNEEFATHLTSIFSLSPDGFVSFDSLGRLITTNPAFLGMTGVSLQDLVGLDMAEFDDTLRALADPRQRFPAVTELGKLFDKDAMMSSVNLPPEITTFDLIRPVRRVIKRSVRCSAGGWPEVVFYFRDITRESEVDRMKSDFLSTAAHELRTPMASIYGFAELLLKRPYDEKTRIGMMETIHHQSKLLINMVNELLDLARIEARAGKDFYFRVQPLAPIIGRAVSTIALPGDPRKVDVSIPADLPLVNVDEEKVQQALTNVLSNACKYSSEDSDVAVAAQPLQQGARAGVGIVVTDKGIGMTAEQAANAFDRFYRADTSGNIPGTGLGLALVKEIIEIHGGSAWIDSAPGEGTSFTIWLPLASQGAAPAAVASTAASAV